MDRKSCASVGDGASSQTLLRATRNSEFLNSVPRTPLPLCFRTQECEVHKFEALCRVCHGVQAQKTPQNPRKTPIFKISADPRIVVNPPKSGFFQGFVVFSVLRQTLGKEPKITATQKSRFGNFGKRVCESQNFGTSGGARLCPRPNFTSPPSLPPPCMCTYPDDTQQRILFFHSYFFCIRFFSVFST